MQTSFFYENIKVEGSVTFQNSFSSMADFRAVLSVLPCSPTNIKAREVFVAVRKRLIDNSRQ